MTAWRTAELPATIDPELARKVRDGGWMYEWKLTSSVTTRLFSANLASVHLTRLELIEPVARKALSEAGSGACAIDIACNEGWFSHRLLEWGAERVIGIDIREDNIRRANLLRDHFRIPPERLSFKKADALNLDRAATDRFDVVLALGLIYHLERPLEAIRVCRRLTRGVCLIESQLTRQDRPIVRGDGVPNVYHRTAESFAAWVEDDDQNPLASAGGVMSLVPNRAALEAMPRWAGFAAVEPLAPQSHHDIQYVAGDRAVIAAYVDTPDDQGAGSET